MDHLRDHAICLRTTVVVLFQGWSTSISASFALCLPPICLVTENPLPEASGVFVISAIFDQLMSIFVHVAVPQIDQVSGIFADQLLIQVSSIDSDQFIVWE